MVEKKSPCFEVWLGLEKFHRKFDRKLMLQIDGRFFEGFPVKYWCIVLVLVVQIDELLKKTPIFFPAVIWMFPKLVVPPNHPILIGF